MATLDPSDKWSQRLERWIERYSRLLAGVRRHLWKVSFLRATGETGFLLLLLLALVLEPMKTAPGIVVPATMFLFALLCGGLAGLRLRIGDGPWKKGLAGEGLFSLILSATLVLIVLCVLALGNNLWLLARSIFQPAETLLVMGAAAPAFLAVRVLARLGLWWNHRRQQQFFYALIHAQLTVVVLSGLLLMALGLAAIGYTVYAELKDLANLPGSPSYSVMMQIIVWLLGLIFLTLLFVGVGMVVLFPPAFVFSSLMARGLTRRVERLAQAAVRLRAGDLEARVAVEGADELAQLQVNFNRMAEDLQQRTEDLEKRTQELKQERDRTAALLTAHRELTVSVSHELRTPLATARTSLDALLDAPADLANEPQRRDLQTLAAEMDRLGRLIDDLFTLSRVEVDRLSLNLETVAVNPLVRCLAETAEKTAWELRRVQVTVELAEQPLLVRVDPARLEQVVRNLLQNGIRYTPPGGYVLLTTRVDAQGVQIGVEDSGEGIAAADLPHIWERFYRASAAQSSGDGAGLGLALVKELVEAMGGSVGVESRPGEGSRFWVILPACDTIAT